MSMNIIMGSLENKNPNTGKNIDFSNLQLADIKNQIADKVTY